MRWIICWKHYFLVRDWTTLWDYLDHEGYRRAKLRHDPSTRGLALDLEFGCQALMSKQHAIEFRLTSVARLWRYSFDRVLLASRVKEQPEQVYTILVLQFHEKNAIELMEVLPEAGAQARALHRIGQALGYRSQKGDEAHAILLRSRDMARKIRDHWEQSDTLFSISTTLAANRHWDTAIETAREIGSTKRRIRAFGEILEALASAGESARFTRTLSEVEQLAMQSGLSFPDERNYRRMEQILANPDRSFDILEMIDPFTDELVIAEALISGSTEALLEYLSSRLDRLPPRLIGNVYRRLVRYICEERPELGGRIEWTVFAAEPTGLDQTIEQSLLLNLGGLGSQATARLSRSLASANRSNGLERAEAIVALDGDISELAANSDGARYKNDALESALTVARAIDPGLRRNEVLHSVAASYVRSGNANRGAEIDIEAGGGPLAIYMPPLASDISKQIEELLDVDFHEGYSLRNSDYFLEGAIRRANWGLALQLIHEDQMPRDRYENLIELRRKESEGRLLDYRSLNN